MTGIVVAVTASGLAVGTGVALDRLVLPELRTQQIAASGPGARQSTSVPAETQRDSSTTAGAGTATGEPPPAGTPAPRTEEQPPLKPMRVPGAATEPSKPTRSPTPDGTQRSETPDGPTGSTNPEAAVVSLTNAERAKAGCGPLRVDERLVTAARRHSADMAADNYFDHTARNGEGPFERMADAGYPSPGAENIAKGYPTAAAVVAGWMNSPGHRANILNCGLRAIGVGRASGPGGPLWTQDFGRT